VTKKRQSPTFGTQSSRRRFAKRSSVTFKEDAMALKDLLVCIDPTSAGDARLKLAFNLARANKAHLSTPERRCISGPE
jgi:hypothetical protein